MMSDEVIDLSHELVEEVASSYGNEDTSDAILVVEERRLPVHRYLLSIQSEFFKILFSKRFEGHKKWEFDLQDVDVTGFELLLRFIYGKRVNVNELTNEEVTALFSTSKQFLFLSLSKKLIDFMASTVANGSKARTGREASLELALSWFSLAIVYDEKELLEAVKSFLESKAEYLLKDSSFLSSSFDVIRELLSSDAFYAKEMDIFHFIRKWLEAQATEGKEEVDIKAAYDLVRFPLISSQYLVKFVPSVEEIGLDFKQHEGSYRGINSWIGYNKRLGDVSYEGPDDVLSSGHSYDKDLMRRSFFIEFNRPHRLSGMIFSPTNVCLNCSNSFRISVYAMDGEGREQLTHEVRCAPFSVNGRDYRVDFIPVAVGSKVTLTDLSRGMDHLKGVAFLGDDKRSPGSITGTRGYHGLLPSQVIMIDASAETKLKYWTTRIGSFCLKVVILGFFLFIIIFGSFTSKA